MIRLEPLHLNVNIVSHQVIEKHLFNNKFKVKNFPKYIHTLTYTKCLKKLIPNSFKKNSYSFVNYFIYSEHTYNVQNKHLFEICDDL